MTENLLKFKGSWRSYQKRILDNLEFHLLDKKLHIVAAPGAGKTTLGIEVISRINRCSLILCPTNTIKNQWRDRICSAFLEEKDFDKVSTDIRKPAYITVTTYQALLAAFCEGAVSKKSQEDEDIPDERNDYDVEEDIEDDSITSSKRFSQSKADEIINILQKSGVSLLCFDEAHHLRNEWWKALTYLVENLEPKQTVSLTATPPYDVDYKEWHRYEELCGPIDEVISIPELVKNGDLCPHQDFIYFSFLRENEKGLLKKYNKAVSDFMQRILADDELIDYLSNMSFLNPKDEDIENIFDDPDFYVSIVSLLKSKGIRIPKSFLALFDAKEFELPNFDITRAKSFLNGFLIDKCDLFKGLEKKIEEYNNLAKHYGLVHNKKIVLNDSKKIQKQIANSLGKLDSIKEIVGLELSSLDDGLRMVVLADFIKAEDMDNSHLGVIPIWRTLKDKYSDSCSIGVLCGTLIIIPSAISGTLKDLMNESGVSSGDISVSPYKEDENFLKITPKEAAKHKIVSLITELFNRGHLTILIGTQALLGEGWDAPVINSLILSSTVSSYMLSNQMRGRAIRVDKNNPNKISNIWHLASVCMPDMSDAAKNLIFQETFSDSDTQSDSGLYDLTQLTKRFEGYEAPSYNNNHEIQSGISRLLGNNYMAQAKVKGDSWFTEYNRLTFNYAKDREQTKTWWENSLYSGYTKGTMTVSTGVESERATTRTLVYTGYKQAFISLGCLYLAINYLMIANGLINLYVFLFWFVCFAVAAIYILLKFLRTGSAASVMKQIAIVHLETLYYLGYIKTSLHNVGISVSDTDYLYVSCKNLQTEENNLLIKAIQEFLDPIENPRYLLIRKNTFMGAVRQVDYFAIPSIISQNKKSVQIFESLWKKYIGNCEMFYTRNLEGRKLLLKARKSAFSATKRSKSRKLSKWQ
ncbi:DEAD/DEAH box helicase family protein [bacterium]|nr:DEAD/DEAH box helicase family protein [bacterium]